MYKGRLYVTLETGKDRVTMSQELTGTAVKVIVANDGVALSQPPSVFTEDSRVIGR